MMPNDDNKRKSQTSNEDESPQKILKATPTNSRFINTMITQWSKRTGTQFPSTNSSAVMAVMANSDATKTSQIEVEHKYTEQKYKVQLLQKKLQIVEDAKLSLSSSLEMEIQNRNEIMEKLNATWKSIDAITNYYNYISESLGGFQQHTANLSTLYDTTISTQSSTLTKLQNELKAATDKAVEREKFLNQTEIKMAAQEKRLQELSSYNNELKEEVRDYKNKLATEVNNSLKLQEEEKSKLKKEQEIIMSEREKLKKRLTRIEKEKANVTEQLSLTERMNNKFQEEISSYKDQIKDLFTHNEELSKVNDQLVNERNELAEKLERKLKEIEELHDDLRAEKQKGNDLVKDKTVLEKRILDKTEQCAKLLQDLENAIAQLKRQEAVNVELRDLLEASKEENATAICQLNEKMESLQMEKENLLLQTGSSVEEIESLRKSLEKKHQEEISNMQKEFDAGISKSEKIINRYRKEASELSASLSNMKEETKVLNEKSSQLKQDNDDLHKTLKTYIEIIDKKTLAETTLKEKCSKYETELKVISDRYKEIQKRLESQADELKKMQADTTLHFDDLQKKLSPRKSILKSPKKITFDVTSSSGESTNLVPFSQAFNSEERFDDLYREISMTQLQSELSASSQKADTNKGTSNEGSKKFFKSRVTRPRTYTSQKKK